MTTLTPTDDGIREALHDVSATKLRRLIYDSERILVEARKHRGDAGARFQIEANERFVPIARNVAQERGITLRVTR